MVLPDVFRECLQLAAIQVEQPPAALAHHVGVQVAVVVVADILVAGGRTLRGGEATQLPGGRQALQVAVNGGLADPLFPQDGTKGLGGDGAGKILHGLQNQSALAGLIAFFHGGSSYRRI